MTRGSERRTFSVLAASVALALFAGSATAQEQRQDRARNDDNAGGAATRAIAAEAPNARLAVLIAAGGEVIRQKGVQSVQRLRKGEYCIRPTAASGVDPRTAVLTASTEFFYTRADLFETLVQWAARGSQCGADRIGIYTLADYNSDGFYVFSNDVAFSVVVP
jgi:hypothetical protein